MRFPSRVFNDIINHNRKANMVYRVATNPKIELYLGDSHLPVCFMPISGPVLSPAGDTVPILFPGMLH